MADSEHYAEVNAQYRRLERAFRHWVYREHDYTPGCEGCTEGAAFLAVFGYTGNVDHPLTS